jgi:uncharacterized protein (TIGR02600 family)
MRNTVSHVTDVGRLGKARRRTRGVALVIVLSVLVLLTILVVGFLTRSMLDRSSASAYFESTRNKLLADQAVNIVQAQINHAASQRNTAWASQPGMVRTFNQDGTLLNAYKLYSDSDMIAGSVNITAATGALKDWQKSPAHLTDLNEPVEVSGTNTYPILDPSALELKPDGQPKVEGFEVTGTAPSATTRQPLPMPVRWLYVLQDGQTVAPSNTSGTTATILGAAKENPIVGRIAFWTDDETCKLNINTASQGQFWDIPRAFSLDERDRMARFQPALGEYQRYPGHPASTSLWPALGYKIPAGSKTTLEIDRAFGDFVYPLIPRIQGGGSEGGTKFATSTAIDKTKDIDRLYVSTDELLFSSFKGVNGPLVGTRKAQIGLDRGDIERTKFFLTARSNNPEVNLFNLPRMAIWPINAGTKTPSTLDKVIASCATINSQKYFLQRSLSTSGTADLKLDLQPDGKGRNEQLYGYINALLKTPFPGFGTESFADKYKAPETAQIATSIFDYIRSSNLYSTALGATAYTGTGTNPFKTQGSQSGQATPLQIGDTKGFGRIPAISQAILHLYVCGLRSAKGDFSLDGAYPLKTGTTPLYASTFAVGNYESIRRFLDDTGAGNPVELLVGGIIYFDMFDPMQGNAVPRYNFDIAASFGGDWQIKITGTSSVAQNLGFQDATVTINHDHQGLWDSKTNKWVGVYNGRIYGGNLGPLFSMGSYTHLRDNNPSNNALEYPLAGNPLALGQKVTLGTENSKITLPDSTTVDFGNVSFSGGTVTASIKVGGSVVQTYTFDFPAFTKPAPAYARRGYMQGDTDPDLVLKQLATSADFRHRWAHQAYANRRNPAASGGAYCDLWLLQDNDTVVSLEPAYGDKRILAARPVLSTGSLKDDKLTPSTANFVPNEDYDSSTIKIAADFRNEPFGYDRRVRAFEAHTRPGRILDLVYGGNAMPSVPNRYPHGVKETTDGKFWPDFDNGVLHMEDDAYVNRADEGTVSSSMDDDSIGSGTGDRGFPWYRNELYDTLDVNTFFSPNKQMPSAGMFGSLPTGAVRNKPWQTLLFRPNPGNHPGPAAPADYLLLDLFWMPVVEPYAISERFSSNGKVNMNYQIMPFGYLHRSTALRGVLRKQEVVSIDDLWAYQGTPDPATGYAGVLKSGIAVDDEYKKVSFGSSVAAFSTKVIRRTLNLSSSTGTLKTFENLFSQNQIFRSETQICSVPLIPADAAWSADFEKDYWDTRRLTGDNSREMPYTQLLPRLTTRSNTYRVHFRVQSLKKAPPTAAGVWDEAGDKVVAEFRGSRIIERYVDPNDTRIPDYAAEFAANPSADPSAAPQTLDAFYRWRTLHNQTFAP